MDALHKLDRGLLEKARALPPSAPEAPTSMPGTATPGAKTAEHGIPLQRAHDSFKSFDRRRNPGMKQAAERCCQVAEGSAWCVLLSGGFGTGKTHLGIATLMAWIGNGGAGYFWKVPDFLDWLRQRAYGDGAHWSIEELTESYRSGPALIVFDDLGTENPTEWAHEQLYRVLDSRYDRRLPTVLTTNQDLGRIDGRILSRYREGLVVCRGRDMRARPGEEEP